MSKAAVVTGASRGIGAAVARTLAASGWDVAVCYRNDDRSARTVAEHVEALGHKGLACRVDVGDEGQVVALFERVHAELGRPMALVNNAGIVAVPGPLATMSAARMEQVLRVNVLGTLLCARQAVRAMSLCHGGDGGVIVNVSSGATRIGSPNEYVDYAAAKGAVEVLTVGLAREVGPEGIRVNAVRPGVVDTEIHARNGQADKLERISPTVPLGRPGRPEEVAAAICWLCSDDASYVNGAILDVTGGR